MKMSRITAGQSRIRILRIPSGISIHIEKTEAGNPFIKAYKADMIEALAGTVAYYNALCEAGEDTQFNL